MTYLFYRHDGSGEAGGGTPLPGPYSGRLWRPSWHEAVPAGLAFFPFAIWWLFHYTQSFANDGYGIYLIHAGEALVHRSVVTPRYFRFPFMGRADLQIGDTWTDPAHRRRGLAAHALGQIVGEGRRPGRRFWYVVQKDNRPSIITVEKAGFFLYGEGARTRPFGLSLLGAFVVEAGRGPSGGA